MSYTLQSPAIIAGLITGQDFAGLDLLRKQQLATQVVSAADSLDQLIPVLVARAQSALEAAFIKALVSIIAGTAPLNTAPAALLPWTPSVTSVGDGAPGSLEQIVTLTLTTPDLRMVYLTAADSLQNWLLYPSTAATANDGTGVPAVQRPLDFDAASNAKVWFRKA